MFLQYHYEYFYLNYYCKDGENTVLGVFNTKNWDLFSSLSWLEVSTVVKQENKGSKKSSAVLTQ